MARPKKDKRRATGIQAKRGYLYMVVSETVIKDGKKKPLKKWIATGLQDMPENIAKASEMRSKILSNKNASSIDRSISVTDYVNSFLCRKKREVADTAYAAYEYRAKHITDAFGNLRVKDIREDDVESFLDDLFAESNLQPRSVKDIKVIFASLMEQAVKDGIISHNPVKNVIINKNLARKHAHEKNVDDEFFSYEEAQLFLDGVKGHELYELFYVTLFFGLRREEVLGLRWSAIGFNDKTMIINHTVTKGTTINRTNATKTDTSTRTYPLSDDQIQMFIRMKARESENRTLCGNSYHENDYVFKHIDGTLYYPDHPSKCFKKLIKGMPELPQGITFHGLRSSCVSILVHQGLDVKSIQKWVGHADIETTLKIYAKVKDKEAKKEVLNAMTDIITLKDYK